MRIDLGLEQGQFSPQFLVLHLLPLFFILIPAVGNLDAGTQGKQCKTEKRGIVTPVTRMLFPWSGVPFTIGSSPGFFNLNHMPYINFVGKIGDRKHDEYAQEVWRESSFAQKFWDQPEVIH